MEYVWAVEQSLSVWAHQLVFASNILGVLKAVSTRSFGFKVNGRWKVKTTWLYCPVQRTNRPSVLAGPFQMVWNLVWTNWQPHVKEAIKLSTLWRLFTRLSSHKQPSASDTAGPTTLHSHKTNVTGSHNYQLLHNLTQISLAVSYVNI